MWNTYFVCIAILFTLTGAITTLASKSANMMKSINSVGEETLFNHPFIQSLLMFLGETYCMPTFFIIYAICKRKGEEALQENTITKGNIHFNPLYLCIPAFCDLTASCLLFMGLTMTYASSYQMLRGSVIIFVSILSIIFLGRRLVLREYIGILLVIIGLVLVGVADYKSTDNVEQDEISTNEIIIGDVLIVISQLAQATHMIFEEKFVTGMDIPPVFAVAWEGIFGFSIMGSLQIPMYFIILGPNLSKNPRHSLEDVIDAFTQIFNNYKLALTLFIPTIATAIYNFAGITITKQMSSLTRKVLDSARTIIVWICSILLLDQSFEWLQLVGLVFLIYGMFLYTHENSYKLCVMLYNKITNKPDEEDENAPSTSNAVSKNK